MASRVDGSASPSGEKDPPWEPKDALFERFRHRLKNIKAQVFSPLFDYSATEALRQREGLDKSVIAKWEEALLVSDFGADTTKRLLAALRGAKGGETPKEILRRELLAVFRQSGAGTPLEKKPLDGFPRVILLVGVNGSGKTTTAGKLAYRFRSEGESVLLCAADTFRAAAGEQLALWAKRASCPIVAHKEGANPAAVVFDAIHKAHAEGFRVVIADTAGRLHTKTPLLEELKKVARIAGRESDGAPHEVLLAMDAATGQNAIHQAREFHAALGVTGLALTKLDGTAKGGSIFRIAHELKIPVRYVGMGEHVDDLEAFLPEAFVDALLDEGAEKENSA